MEHSLLAQIKILRTNRVGIKIFKLVEFALLRWGCGENFHGSKTLHKFQVFSLFSEELHGLVSKALAHVAWHEQFLKIVKFWTFLFIFFNNRMTIIIIVHILLHYIFLLQITTHLVLVAIRSLLQVTVIFLLLNAVQWFGSETLDVLQVLSTYLVRVVRVLYLLKWLKSLLLIKIIVRNLIDTGLVIMWIRLRINIVSSRWVGELFLALHHLMLLYLLHILQLLALLKLNYSLAPHIL